MDQELFLNFRLVLCTVISYQKEKDDLSFGLFIWMKAEFKGGDSELWYQYVGFEIFSSNLSRSVQDSICYLDLEKRSLSPRVKSVNYCHGDRN